MKQALIRDSSGARQGLPPAWLATLALLLLVTRAPGALALEFFACGDLPYSDTEYQSLGRLLDSAAARDPAFILHVGDIKGGGQPCTSARDRQIAELFARQPRPMLYTPGDNEWTDCHRAAAGGGDPLARLTRLRQAFFRDPGVLHHQVLKPRVPNANFPENRWFERDKVVVVLAHVVGSNNGFGLPGASAKAAFAARAAANRALLLQAAEAARAGQAQALVLAIHANPLFERAQPGGDGPTRGFAPLFNDLAAVAATYPGPILLIHGDTHRYRFDQPWNHDQAGQRLWRLEVPGSPFVAGVWVAIKPEESPVFAVRPLSAPAISVEPASSAD
jgi:hypothetical protein